MANPYKSLRDYLKATLPNDLAEVYSDTRPNKWSSPCVVLVKVTDEPQMLLRGYSGEAYAEIHVLTYAATRAACIELTDKVKLALIGHDVTISGIKSVQKLDYQTGGVVEVVEKAEYESHGLYRVQYSEVASL